MREFTLDDLRRILRASGGENDATTLAGDIHDSLFVDLGYDSLALLELASRVEDEFHVVIPDDAIISLPTPGDIVAYVNERLREVAHS